MGIEIADREGKFLCPFVVADNGEEGWINAADAAHSRRSKNGPRPTFAAWPEEASKQPFSELHVMFVISAN